MTHFFDKKWEKTVNLQFFSFLFDKIYKKIPQNFMKSPENIMKNSQTFIKNSQKFTYSPTSYQKRRHMGQFKNPIWCTVDETLGAKLQI